MKPNAFTRDIVGLRKELLSPTYEASSWLAILWGNLSLRERDVERPGGFRRRLALRLLDRRGRRTGPDRRQLPQRGDPASARAHGIFLEARRARNAGTGRG